MHSYQCLEGPWGNKYGFEEAIEVFDRRIVRSILRVQKSSQTQTFSNKASFLCPQGCNPSINATDLFI